MYIHTYTLCVYIYIYNTGGAARGAPGPLRRGAPVAGRLVDRIGRTITPSPPTKSFPIKSS